MTARSCSGCGKPISASSRGQCKACVKRRRPVPDDFAEVVARLGSARAARHYQSSLSTVTRWRRELGMAPHRPAKPTRPRNGGNLRGFGKSSLFRHKIYSRVELAAEYLCRLGPTFRCGPLGGADAKGKYWNRGGHVLTDHEILERANLAGWVTMFREPDDGLTPVKRRLVARDARIVLDYMRGRSMKAIGADHRITDRAVGRILKLAGHRPSPEQRKARQRAAVIAANSAWPNCPPELREDYATWRRYIGARAARAKLDRNYRQGASA